MWRLNKCKFVRCAIIASFLKDVLNFICSTSCRKQFFEKAGEVYDIRFATFDDGSFKGFAHVEFATAEAAEKVLNYFSL